jgi:NADP-dependent aldehyde dehydrogenase
VFGPATLVLTADSPAEIFAVAEHLEGQLTASIHASSADATVQAALSPILERRAGRLVFGGFPTGVEVCHSMVHGGPYPATSDGRSTSVGTQSIYRFTRLVSWQSFPDASLPAELQESNPLGIRRMVDGKYV